MAKSAFILAATQSGCGKTTFSMGLMTALRKLGHSVQPFKVGPDYIDPMYHTAACGRPSRNLDSVMLPEETLRYLFRKNSADADLAVIEGVMGLFDGLNPSSIAGSTAHISQILDVPIILLINARGMSLSIAALINGFRDFVPGLKIAGVLLNNVKSKMLFTYVKGIIEQECGLPVFGWLPNNPDFALSERHLGLYCSNETPELDAKFSLIADTLIANCDLSALLEATKLAPAAPPRPQLPERLAEPVKLGVARDSAFNFYYQDSLDLLAELGAELIPFSPIADDKLPDADAIYLGGGYPELHLPELSANTVFLQDIRTKLKGGLPCFAECGGFIYLGESMTMEGKNYKLTGIFPFEFAMTDRLQHFGYMEAEIAADTPLTQTAPTKICGHEFHYTQRIDKTDYPTCYQVTKPGKKLSWQEGYQAYNTLGGYPHFNFYANPTCAKSLLLAAAEYRDNHRKI
jgi:cobyrinic acid a,c-diamide synthase